MLDADESWRQVRDAARIAMHAGRSFWSMKIGREYRIQSVEDERIVIQRLRGQPTVLTPRAVARAVDLLNQSNGGIQRRTLLPKVAREAVFVSLHPRLRWSDDRNRIEIDDSLELPVVYKDFGQAPNDDPSATGIRAQGARGPAVVPREFDEPLRG